MIDDNDEMMIYSSIISFLLLLLVCWAAVLVFFIFSGLDVLAVKMLRSRLSKQKLGPFLPPSMRSFKALKKILKACPPRRLPFRKEVYGYRHASSLHGLPKKLVGFKNPTCFSNSFVGNGSPVSDFRGLNRIRCQLSILHRNFGDTAAKGTLFASEAEYDLKAEYFLEDLSSRLDELDEQFDSLDVDYSQGVLTVQLGDVHGTYVLNKQRPNQQIWFSSPTSGPKRFEYNFEKCRWVSTRDGEDLVELLMHELLEIDENISIDLASIYEG